MSEDLFTLDIVRDFIAAKGGKVPNHVLVTHFKLFLNDPRHKVINREKFKQYVNTLASVKLDPSGEKLLVLKKKYRDDYIPPKEDVQDERPKKWDAPKAKLKDSFPVRKPSEEQSVDAEDGKMFSQPEYKAGGPAETAEDSLLDAITKELGIKQDAASTPSVQEEVFESVSEEIAIPTATSLPSLSEEQEVFHDALQEQESAAGEKMSDVQQEERAGSPVSTVSSGPTASESLASAEPEVMISKAYTEQQSQPAVSFESAISSQPPLSSAPGSQSATSSAVSFHSAVSSREQTPSSREQTPSSDVEVRTSESRESSVENQPETDKENEAPELEASVVSVKDRAKHLNKISSTQLPNVVQPKKSAKRQKDDLSNDSSSSLMITLDDDERQWLLFSCKADYQEMHKLLIKRPDLAPKKDFITGFTALHWACKKGSPDVVKLLCGTGSININAKSNGGYTPLHLAAMQGHEDVIEVLVQVYGADTNVRDHSGKKAKQYLNNRASSRTQQLLQSSRLSQASSQLTSSKYSIGSKVKAISSGLNPTSLLKHSFGERASSVQRSLPSNSPSPSPGASPSLSRKTSVVSAPGDAELMPPPCDLPPRPSKNKRNKRAIKSEADGKQEMVRSGSDTVLNRGSTHDMMEPMHGSSSYSSMV